MTCHRSKHSRSRLAYAAGGAVALFVSQAIHAQDQGGLQEVVVTAQRREQNGRKRDVNESSVTGRLQIGHSRDWVMLCQRNNQPRVSTSKLSRR